MKILRPPADLPAGWWALGTRYSRVRRGRFTGAPGAGKPYVMNTLHLYRTEGDKLAEHWRVRDEVGVLIQLGVLPHPQLPTAPSRGPFAIGMDLHMLLLFGARERTRAQFDTLLREAGFAVRSIIPTASPAGLSVIEAVLSALDH